MKKNYDSYVICGSHAEALKFIAKLEAQNIDYTIKIGVHSTGDWTKIEYNKKGFDPFYKVVDEEED